MKRTGTTTAAPKRTLAERFWEKVDRRGPDDCWLWTSALNEHGYGVLHPEGKRSGAAVRAHRVALMLTGVDVTDSLIRHSCDNPPCVNPAHLSLGTPADNAADRNERGRTARGSRCGTHKLDEAQVSEIIRRHAAGELQRVLATAYGVSRPTISRIVNRRSWLHVEAITGEDIDRHAAGPVAALAA